MLSLITRKSTKLAKPGALAWPFFAALGVVWALAFSAGVWWVALCSVRAQQAAAVERAEMLGDHLSSSVEPLLAAGELSAVRRLITEAGYQQKLEECRLILADGKPLVDADLDKPQLTVLPASWPGGDVTDGQTRIINGRIEIDRVVMIPGKGEATLLLATVLPPASLMLEPMLPGAVLAAAVGLVMGLLVLRKLRGRLEVLSLIHGALRDAGSGAVDLGVLAVNPKWGIEAAGWNRLIAGKQIEEQAAFEQLLERLNTDNESSTLEDACEGLWNGLLTCDARGRISYINGAAAASLGLNRDRAIDMPLVSQLGGSPLAPLAQQLLSGTGPGRIRHEFNVGEEQCVNTLRVTMRRLNESGGLVMTVEDITQQRVAEASRNDFVSRATHELRSPLTNIRLYIETAQDDGQNDPELRGECLNVISREAQRLERLVGEMLSVSEIEAGSMTIRNDDVRLDQLFKSLEKDYAANAQSRNLDLRFELPPKLPVIQGDRDKLAIVLQNLMGNAIKYTPEGGKVIVSVDLSATDLNIEVRDSGIGISEEDQKHVFEKFYRANDPRLGEITGSGLGLALAYEIVRLHGGELTVDSVLNEGSTFRVVLPIVTEGV